MWQWDRMWKVMKIQGKVESEGSRRQDVEGGHDTRKCGGRVDQGTGCGGVMMQGKKGGGRMWHQGRMWRVVKVQGKVVGKGSSGQDVDGGEGTRESGGV